MVTRYGPAFLTLIIVLCVLLGFLFRESFHSEMALFANDGPLGAVEWVCQQGWTIFKGIWADLNWVGLNGGASTLGITSVLALVLGAHGFINFYPALMILALGVSAAFFFRRLGFHPAVCVLGGMAAALNSDFFSYACWGLGTLTLCVAWVFLALAALLPGRSPRWVGFVLAGAALGSALIEGFDNGAIFSLYVAAFLVFGAWVSREGRSPARRLLHGAVGTGVVAVVAGIVAAQVLGTTVRLVLNSNPTPTGATTKAQEEAANWNYSTQWSLPPKETLRTVIPGLYGYRMDTPEGGQYWGAVGMSPAWDAYWALPNPDPSKAPAAQLRYSGAGHYAGVLVVLVALFAVAQAFHGSKSVLSEPERAWVWFWTVVAAISLIFAFGRFGLFGIPFYRMIYALPYFHTIRNPVKYLHPYSVALVVLFAYGLQALWRGWLSRSASNRRSLPAAFKSWWPAASPWERRWTLATLAAIAISLLAWLIYGSSRGSLIQYLGKVMPNDTDTAAIAGFSIREVGLFALLLAISTGLLIACLTGVWSGRKSVIAFSILGLVLVVDLARANSPWIVYFNWKNRYATNALFDTLRGSPQDGRVTGNVPLGARGQAGALQRALGQVYGGEWIQHEFRYYDIQSLDVVQMPRTPPDVEAYQTAMAGHVVREWELTNTRYLVTLAPLVDGMNRLLDPEQNRFRLRMAFTLSQTPDGAIQVHPDTTAPLALSNSRVPCLGQRFLPGGRAASAMRTLLRLWLIRISIRTRRCLLPRRSLLPRLHH